MRPQSQELIRLGSGTEELPASGSQAALVQQLRRQLPFLIYDEARGEPSGIALYTLSDPRDVRAIRYVGQSRAPVRRYRQHVAAARLWLTSATPWWIRVPRLLPLYQWLRELHAEGERLPFMLVAQRVESAAEALALEQRLISDYRGQGFSLLNCDMRSTGVAPARRARERAEHGRQIGT